MPSRYRTHYTMVLVCLFGVLGGVAAERYRQYVSGNVGDVTIQRTDAGITLSIDGESFTDLHRPVTLRAGSHRLHATWQRFEVKATINVKRGDKAPLNRVVFSLQDGQLQVKVNSRLVDVSPRPEPEVSAIQTASGRFWRTSENGEITARDFFDVSGVQLFTIHWLRPDRSEAFIQSSDGRFVTNTSGPLDESPGVLALSDHDDRPCLFKIDRINHDGSWIHFATGRHFVDVNADTNRVRTTCYEQFATPHFLKKVTVASDDIKPVALPAGITAVQAASNAPSVRRFKGHTNVIRAVVFTPDGKQVITGSSDGTIRFWNLQSGKQVDMVRTRRPALSLAISSDGESLACGMTDAVVKFWKLEKHPTISHHSERILSRDYKGDVLAIAFSPDGTKVAAGGNRQQHSRIWNLLEPGERCKSSTINGPVTSLVWSRSGERVLLCEEDSRSLRWFPTSTKNAAMRPSDQRSGKLLIPSDDGPFVVVGGEVLDAETLEVIHTFQQRRGVRAVSGQLLDRKNLLVTADVIVNAIHELAPDEFVTAWDLNTGLPLAVLRDHAGQTGNVAISPSGDYVAYGNGVNDTNGTYPHQPTGDYDLRVWKITGDEPADEREPE